MDRVCWRTVRFTRAGLIRYRVICLGGPEPYAIAVQCRGALALQQQLTADQGRAIGWCRRLAAGHVRPCHLQELLSEWICE